MIKTNIDDPRLAVFHTLKENQLYHYNEPNPGIFIAESPNVILRAINAGYMPISFLAVREQLTDDILKAIDTFDSEVYICSKEELSSISGYPMTRGLLCAMNRKPNPDVNKLCSGKNKIAVLENIMNPTNVGAIIRSGVALGIEAFILTKGCADPLQRRASRVSMGNVFAIDWTVTDNIITDVDLLKSHGFRIISMALSKGAEYINNIDIKKNEKIAVIMGSEKEGINAQTLEKSDNVVMIPMANGVDSLNVACASAVAFWEVCKNR